MAEVATVIVQLPSTLDPILKGDRRIEVQGATIREALDCLFSRHPELRAHLFDETGSFREHVLCFHNETNTRWLDGMDEPIRDGDTLTILQAVSGG